MREGCEVVSRCVRGCCKNPQILVTNEMGNGNEKDVRILDDSKLPMPGNLGDGTSLTKTKGKQV